jgi:hypothetical protein
MEILPPPLFFTKGIPGVPGITGSLCTTLPSRPTNPGQEDSLASPGNLLKSLSDRFFFPFTYKIVT